MCMNAFERVKRWQKEWLESGQSKHWGDTIVWTTAEEIARRLDEPVGLESAPRDGSLFDVQQNGVPYLDCHFSSTGALVQEHDYPSMTRIFNMGVGYEFSWTPRPADRIMPYARNAQGLRYIP